MEKGASESDRIKEQIKEYWDRTREHAFFKDGEEEEEEEEEAWRNSLHAEFGVGREKQKIVDVGTGNGSLALLLAEMGHDVVGIDISEGMLSVARKKG
jgi:2-polyprenyl-3-methyl-5-hydroxy-6-metoxy-1,4-benzoquinol methylase